MSYDLSASSSPRLRLRVRPFRIAEALMILMFGVAMGLPLLFLLTGSFNLAPPGREAVYGIANWARAFSDPEL